MEFSRFLIREINNLLILLIDALLSLIHAKIFEKMSICENLCKIFCEFSILQLFIQLKHLKEEFLLMEDLWISHFLNLLPVKFSKIDHPRNKIPASFKF